MVNCTEIGLRDTHLEQQLLKNLPLFHGFMSAASAEKCGKIGRLACSLNNYLRISSKIDLAKGIESRVIYTPLIGGIERSICNLIRALWAWVLPDLVVLLQMTESQLAWMSLSKNRLKIAWFTLVSTKVRYKLQRGQEVEFQE